MPIRCEHFEPKPKPKTDSSPIPSGRSCGECLLWVSPKCLDHIQRVKIAKHDMLFEKMDRLMRTNKGVWLG